MNRSLLELPAGCYLERGSDALILRNPDGAILGELANNARGDVSSLRVRFFGGFELLRGGGAVPLGHNMRAVAILKYMLAHRPRPDSNLRHARWSLNSAVYALRRILCGCVASAGSSATVLFDKGAYRLSLDPAMVMEANDMLLGEPDAAKRLDLGLLLEKLLVPGDLRRRFSSNAPLVMTLDSTTARIHWELVAQPGEPFIATDGAGASDVYRFLGVGRDLTRQLRTVFAPPDPPPPPRRLMRVLIVADPAEDARLAGAEEEGIEVAELFESFNAVHGPTSENRVEVVTLFGPYEASRVAVVSELMLHTYDVLHFAGHCVYDESDPASSGWVFSGGARVSARELGRIDRVPAFVFSNACESGVTPDRSEMRSAALAPSFAESFFGRGVSNFVCTAWPVSDTAARAFAATLYSGLLGITEDGSPREPLPMHEAMRGARLSIASAPDGETSWGAYQHYGNPYFRFFDPEGMSVHE